MRSRPGLGAESLMMKTKFCSHCGVEKDINEFRERKNYPLSKSIRYNQCRGCERVATLVSSRTEESIDRRKKYQKIWRKTASGKKSIRKYARSEKHKKTVARYRALERVRANRKKEAKLYEGSQHGRFIVLRKGARRRGLEFALSEENVSSLISRPCFYCGRDIGAVITLNEFIANYQGENRLLKKAKQSISKKVLIASCMSVDRKESFYGYTEDNCVACCGICNDAKGWQFTSDEYLLVAKSLIQRLSLAMEEELCREC